MRALWVVALVCALSIAAQGCKSKKREPLPGPQVSTAGTSAMPVQGPSAEERRAGRERGPIVDLGRPHGMGLGRGGGIVWFQGGIDEAFARPQPAAPSTSNFFGTAR